MSQLELVLASASPRRRELLRLLNLPFQIVSFDVDESPYEGERAVSLVKRLSRAKAQAAQSVRPRSTIVACDTTVESDGMNLGKPRDHSEARWMLQALRGRAHFVYGGITILFPSSNNGTEQRRQEEALVIRTKVWMRDYSDEDIERYIATADPLDKAAGYAVQHPVFRPVDRVEGCYANVMGLALCHLHNALSRQFSLPEPCVDCYKHPDDNCTVPTLLELGIVAGS